MGRSKAKGVPAPPWVFEKIAPFDTEPRKLSVSLAISNSNVGKTRFATVLAADGSMKPPFSSVTVLNAEASNLADEPLGDR